MIYWAQLFHFYQPATQLPSVLEKICDESYRPLLEVFRQHTSARVTVNINAVLTEMLRDHGHNDIIWGLKELAAKGQIEFTGSAKYHPILPLLPPEETRRQIEMNHNANAFFFGDAYRPVGFFPPEMAYSHNILPAVIETGHQWLILSGAACPISWPVNSIAQAEQDGKRLAVFFRDDVLSNKISFHDLGPKDFLAHLQTLDGGKKNVYVITAMDAETYGHHIKQWEKLFLAEVYEQLQVRKDTYAGIQQQKALAVQQTSLLEFAEAEHQIETVTVSQLLSLFPAAAVVDPKRSSWSTSGEDLEAGNHYPLWAGKDNEIHRLQWEHLNIVMATAHKALEIADTGESRHFADIARGLLDRALQSDQFWWASRRPMWDINLIHMGLMEQWRVIINAYRAINVSGTGSESKREFYYKLVAARDLRNKIEDRLFIL